MSLAMYFAMTAINIGLDADFMDRWARSFVIALIIGVP
jgi:Protein of unknown function (DUF2798)